MQINKPWTRQKLMQMLYHAFIGSLADNAIEIGWVLCFSLLADKSLVERITVLFGVNDAFLGYFFHQLIICSNIYDCNTTQINRTIWFRFRVKSSQKPYLLILFNARTFSNR